MSSVMTRGRILVIDSDPQTAAGAARLLAARGYACHCAANADSARQMARQHPMDLILCDTNPGGIPGLELCRQLLHDSAPRPIPLMFLSAHQRPDVVHRVHESRGAYYLRKPYDSEVLLEIVARSLWHSESSPGPVRPLPPLPAHLAHLTRRLRQQLPLAPPS